MSSDHPMPPPPTSTSNAPPVPSAPGLSVPARWAAGVGVLLLIAAAITFLAGRWEGLSDLAKLGVLTAATAGALTGGAALRRSLPATGSAVVHLGTALVAVDAGALALSQQLGAGAVTLLAGLAGLLAAVVAEQSLRTAALRVFAVASTLTAATGVGLLTHAPAAVIGGVLALLAVAVLVPSPRWSRAVGALAAGVAVLPFVGSAVRWLAPDAGLGAGALDAGWVAQPTAVHAAGGMLAVAATLLLARRLRAISLAVVGGAAAIADLALALSDPVLGLDAQPRVAIGLLGVSLIGWLVRSDQEWGALGRMLGHLSVVGAALLSLAPLSLLIDVAAQPAWVTDQPQAELTLVLLTLTWASNATWLYREPTTRLGRVLAHACGAAATLTLLAVPLSVVDPAAVPVVPLGLLALGLASAIVVGRAVRRLPDVVLGPGAALGLLGLGWTATDAEAFAGACIVAGAGIAALGAERRDLRVGLGGGALATVGIWSLLELSGVTVSEPYLAPLAVLAAIGGAAARNRRQVSSWLADTPAVALLGTAALAERVAGGSGWHGVVAGVVGVLAVAAGARWRLAGPLLSGTALVVLVVAVEAFGAVSGIPTWVWLTAGGAGLLGVAVGVERADTSPVDAGRRAIDVIREQFV